MPSVIVAVFVIAYLAVATPADAQTEFETSAPVAILMDAGSGAVYFEKNADRIIAPASMTKIMTAIMVFEALEAGEIRLDDTFRISDDAWRRGGAPSGGSTMFAEVGSDVDIDNLLKELIVHSGNDAAIALAEGLAVSEPAFAARMTERAREIGLSQSVFRNASGLPAENHRSTARELALMARYAIQRFPEEYGRYYSMREFTWNDIRQSNRNPLLGRIQGVDGMKTGFTREAGFGLVASAMRNGRRLIAVVSGTQSADEREREASRLLAWGFRQFRNYELFESGQTIGMARVMGGTRSWTGLIARERVNLMLSDEERKQIEALIVYRGPIRAPVEEGDAVAVLRFAIGPLVLHQVQLYAAHSVEEEGGLLRRAVDNLALIIFGT